MPQTTCPTCGAPVYRSDALTDAGAEVYCSEACAARPWSVGAVSEVAQQDVGQPVVRIDVGGPVGLFLYSQELDASAVVEAARIVRAVNAHDSLVAALEHFIRSWEGSIGNCMQGAADAARAALAKVRGTK